MQICKGKFYFRPWSSWLASEAYLAVSEAFLAASEGFQAAFEALTHASEALGAASETLSVYTAPEAPPLLSRASLPLIVIVPYPANIRFNFMKLVGQKKPSNTFVAV